MKIIINTSTFKQSPEDISPNFINSLTEGFTDMNQFYILYPCKTSKIQNKEYKKNITLIPYKYIIPKKYSDLSKNGLFPSIKKNKFNIIKVMLLVVFQFLNLTYYSVMLKPDLIYSHWLFPQAFISTLVGKFLRIDTVFTSHGSDVKILKNLGWLGKFIVRFSIKNSKKFTVVSSSNLQIIQPLLSNKKLLDKQKIIPMGIEDIFYEQSKNTRKKNNDLVKYLYFGRMVHYKGIDLIIDAAKKMKDENHFNFHIDLIGSGILFDVFEKEIKHLGLDNSISMHHFAQKAELINYIDNADFILIPSRLTKYEYEAGPLSLIESMSRKKICIVSDSVGFIDFANTTNSLIFENDNSLDLYDKILEGSNLSTTQIKNIKRAAYETSLKFKFDEISKKTENYLF
jgi:glycosyltransferase involved in cell wall biosynthesis